MEPNHEYPDPAARPRSGSPTRFRALGSPSRTWLTVLLLILVLLFLFREARTWLPDLYHKGAQSRAVTARGDLAQDEKGTIALFKAASPSVVYITTMTVRHELFSSRAWRCRRAPAPVSSGTRTGTS